MVTLHLINGSCFDLLTEHSKDPLRLAGFFGGKQFDVFLQETNILFVFLLAPGIILNLFFGLLGENGVDIAGAGVVIDGFLLGLLFRLNKDRH